MHYAASEGHRECLRMLLHAGGKLDVLNNDGKSCVDVAFGECHSILQSESVYHKIPWSFDLLEHVLSCLWFGGSWAHARSLC